MPSLNQTPPPHENWDRHLSPEARLTLAVLKYGQRAVVQRTASDYFKDRCEGNASLTHALDAARAEFMSDPGDESDSREYDSQMGEGDTL